MMVVIARSLYHRFYYGNVFSTKLKTLFTFPAFVCQIKPFLYVILTGEKACILSSR